MASYLLSLVYLQYVYTVVIIYDSVARIYISVHIIVGSIVCSSITTIVNTIIVLVPRLVVGIAIVTHINARSSGICSITAIKV